MTINFNTAIDQIRSSSVLSLNQLFNLVESVSGSVSGADTNSIYSLNSGSLPEPGNTRTLEYVKELQKNGAVISAGLSDVGRLLNNPEFIGALKKSVLLKLFGDPFVNPASLSVDDKNIYLSTLNLILNGKSGSITEPSAQRVAKEIRGIKLAELGIDFSEAKNKGQSLWDIASENYVMESVGSFRVIAPDPGGLSVFVETELPALLKLDADILVEGIPLSTLKQVLNDPKGGIDAVKAMISTASLYNLLAADLHEVDVSNGIPESKLNEWLQNAEKWYSEGYPEEVVQRIKQYLADLDPELKAYYAQGLEAGKDIAGSVGWTKGLKAFGPALIFLDFMLATDEAEAMAAEGNMEGARDYMENWAVEFVAGEVASIAATMAATAFLGAVGVTAAPVLIVAGIGAAVAGGMFGANTAGNYFREFKEGASEENLELIHDVSEWLFGYSDDPQELLNNLPHPESPDAMQFHGLNYENREISESTVQMDASLVAAAAQEQIEYD